MPSLSAGAYGEGELIGIALEEAAKKKAKYGKGCADIDLLVYVNLSGRHAYFTKYFSTVAGLADWRSVSVVVEGFGLVLWASLSAPNLLQRRVGRPFSWTKVASVLE